MLTKCTGCKSSFFADMEFCPHCGQRRATILERYGRMVALLLVLLAAAAISYVSSKFYREPTVDPSSLKPLAVPSSSKPSVPDSPSFR
jgi:hypothetical protein